MMKTEMTLSLLAATAAILCAEPLLSENFNGTEKLSPSLEGISRGAALVNAPEGESGRVLELSPKSTAIFKAVKLDPKTKYILTFRARSVGPDCMEENPQLNSAFYDVNRGNKGMKLPGWGLAFSSETKKYCNPHILFPYHKAVLSNQFRTYTDVFYPAPGATQVKVRFENPSQDNRLYVDDVKLEPFTEDGLNINPDFKLGKYDHSGFGQAGYGINIRMVERPDKNGFYLNVASWASSDPVPVEAGKNYVIDAKLAPNPLQGARIQVIFFDRDMKQIKNGGGTLLVKKAEGSGKANFIAPDNAAYLRMLVYGGKDVAFEHIRVVQEDMKMDK